MPEDTQPKIPQAVASRANNLGIPVAIVIAAALIAGAIYMSGVQQTPTSVKNTGTGTTPTEQVTPETTVAPVTEADHIRGNPNAPIIIVEYSDIDCPFCRLFHDTMNKIMADYGADGKVAWVFRQFPIAQLHPNAPKIAMASECVNELGGSEAFWKFLDALNASRKVEYDASGSLKSVEPTNMTRISEFAAKAGVDKGKFELCLNSDKYAEKIQSDVAAATAAGAQGTPYSLLIVGDQQGVINGAQPYETVKQMVETMLSQLGGQN